MKTFYATSVVMFLVIAIVALPSAIRADDWSPLWSTATLSQPRADLTACSVGNLVFFAGGRVNNNPTASNVVDIYDTMTNTWSSSTLSVARFDLAGAKIGSKAFFAGGVLGNWTTTSVVDIYDTATASWSKASLSQARHGIGAATAGGKILFGGGYTNGNVTDRVDIYDVAANTWTTSALSSAQSGPGATSVDNKVIFGAGWTVYQPYGGFNIYNTTTNSWSSGPLSQNRFQLAATSANGKALFAGGQLASSMASDRVDIYDSASGQWSIAALSQPRARLAAASVGQLALVAGGWGNYPDYTPSSVVDIYNAANGTWSTATLSQPRAGLAAASAGNKVLFAGGTGRYNDTASYSNVVDIYTLQTYPAITSSKAWTLVDQTTVKGRMQLNTGASLNLDGFNLTVGSMAGVASINLSTHALTVGGDNTDSSYSGPISGNGALVKTGTSDLALSGSNSYLGLTTISAGSLDFIGPNAWNPVTTLGGAYISGGKLVFDYEGNADPYQTIIGLLGTKINGSMPLCVVDDVANNRVIVSAIPEPSTLALLGVGGIGLIAYRWRRRKA